MISTSAAHPSGWKVRVGIHSGSVVGGLVGSRQFLFDVWGDTVNVAARIEGAGQPQTLTCSKTTFDSLGRYIQGRSLGSTELKGKGIQEIFAIDSLNKV
jgi:class 3 adenylate cyclase